MHAFFPSKKRFVESDAASNIAWSTSSIGAVASQSVKCHRQRAAAVRGAPSQPSRPSSLAEFGNSSTSRNVRESRTPDDDAVVNQAHIEKLERAIEILVEESPQAQGLIAALKQVQERAVVPPIGWSSIGFLSGFRRACQEAPHGCQGGSYQGPPHEKYTRTRVRAKGWQGWRSCGSRSSHNHLCDGRRRSQSLACNYEKGASVSNCSVGTTDRDSSSSGPVWEDGDVDRRCRCRFESLPAIHLILIGKSRDAAHGLRGVRVGETSHPGPSDSESDTVSLPGSKSSVRVSEAAGSECVAHVLQHFTDLDTPAPLLSPLMGSALSTMCRETRCCCVDC